MASWSWQESPGLHFGEHVNRMVVKQGRAAVVVDGKGDGGGNHLPVSIAAAWRAGAAVALAEGGK